MAADVEREDRLDAILADYLRAVEDGSAPSRRDLLDSHPELAAELSEFFADQDRVNRMAAPIRAAAGVAARLPRFRDFGDYEILEEIGRGGMGVVFKAWQKSLSRTVALKMLLAGPLASPDDLQRFRTEAEAVAGLDHPNIVPIHDVGDHNGHPYLTMKLLTGGSLAQAAARSIQPREAARLLAAVADAVHYAHQRGVLHRDLKPANILLDDRGQPYVTDFGLAKQMAVSGGRQPPDGVQNPAADAPRSPTPGTTHTGAVIGTPAYMAPEQAAGRRGAVTIAADVYGLGAVLYELLASRPPFRGATPMETLQLVLEGEVQRPRTLNHAVDRDLETICLKCLAREPVRRYASAADLAADLRRCLAGETIAARRAGSIERLVRSVRRRPVVSALACLLVLTLAVGCAVAGALWLRSEADRIQLAAALRDAQAAKDKADGERTRAESEQQRADQNAQQAEARQKLADVNFTHAHDAVQLLRQLSEKLKTVAGTQPIRREMLQAALDYEEEFSRQHSDDPRLRREQADAQFDAAQITSEIGTNEGALIAYRRARDLYRELHEACPQDVALQRCYVNSINNAGVHEPDVESKRADFEEARRLYEEFLCFHPDDERLLNGLGGALDNLGSGYLNSGRFREAMDCLNQARQIQEELLARDDHRIAFTNDLATTCSNLGALHMRLPGGFAQAESNYMRSCDLYGKLAKALPNEAVRQANYAAGLNSLGILYRDHGDYDKSLGYLLDAEKVRKKVADENPSVGRYQIDLALSVSNVGVTYARKGDRQRALHAHEQARDILAKLAQQDPNSASIRKILAGEWYNIGANYGETGVWAEEAKALGEAYPLQQGLIAEDPSNYDLRCDFGRTSLNLGLALFKVNRLDKARDALRMGVTSLRDGLERSPEGAAELRWLLNAHYVNLSLVERGAGRPDDAAAVTTERLKAGGDDADELYRGAVEYAATVPLYGRGKTQLSVQEQAGRERCAALAGETLRRAVAKGFHDAERFRKEHDFDPLRGRSDFPTAADLEKGGKQPAPAAGPQ
ncbi:MAG TPA: serine/threonine-protein kinase [Gemmataceae bacterium]|nr:serine/threonine-protein kinase [Gemmataceae bacterium]